MRTRVSVWPSFYILPVSFGVVSLLIAVKFVFCLIGKAEPLADLGDAAAKKAGE